MRLSFAGWSRPASVNRRTVLALVFLGYFALGTAWALATPFDGAPDEAHHIVRAAGVVRGQVAPPPIDAMLGTGTVQTVPRSLVRSTCWHGRPTVDVSCDKGRYTDRSLVPVPTSVGRYNPVWYAVVGVPLRFWPSMTGVILGRLINAAMVAALLTLAVSAVLRWFTGRVGLAAVVLMSTPTLLSLSGAYNPSSVEIAAGTLLFTALIPLLRGKRPVQTRMVHYAGIAAAILLTVRAAGPLWLAVGVFALLIPNRLAHLRALAGMLATRIWIAVLAVVGLAGVGWTLKMHALDLIHIATVTPPFTLSESVQFVAANQWGTYLTQMVTGVSWLDTPVPSFVFPLWLAGLGALLVPAVLAAGGRDRYRLLFITVLTFAIPTVTDSVRANLYGFPTQGRYLMPLFVGVPLLAAEVIAERAVLDGTLLRRLVRLTATVLMPVVNLVTLAATMIRWQSGEPDPVQHVHFNPLAGAWHPAVGSLLPLLAAVLGVTLVAIASWQATGPGAAAVPADGAPGVADRDGTPERTDRPGGGPLTPLEPDTAPAHP